MTATLKRCSPCSQAGRRTPLIVCVDDDPHIVKAMRLRLKSMNFDVLQASSGRDGLRLIQERKPDLVISDWWMDNGDGEYLLNRMQAQAETAQIPVIMVSGVGRPDFVTRMFAQGARACFTKPIEFDALFEDVCTLLDLDRSEMTRARQRPRSEPRRGHRKDHHSRRPSDDNCIRVDASDVTSTDHSRN